jgi:hypothetical protein
MIKDFETIQLTGKQLREYSKEIIKNTLRELHMLKKTYTQAEIVKMYGMAAYKKSLLYVKWQKKGNAKSSQVECLCDDFDEYKRRFDIELKQIPNGKE